MTNFELAKLLASELSIREVREYVIDHHRAYIEATDVDERLIAEAALRAGQVALALKLEGVL